jgi:hypothetical protein
VKLDELAAAEAFVAGKYELVIQMIYSHFGIEPQQLPVLFSSGAAEYVVVILATSGRSYRCMIKSGKSSAKFESWDFDPALSSSLENRIIVCTK